MNLETNKFSKVLYPFSYHEDEDDRDIDFMVITADENTVILGNMMTDVLLFYDVNSLTLVKKYQSKYMYKAGLTRKSDSPHNLGNTVDIEH